MKVWSYSGVEWSFHNNREWRCVPFKGLQHLCEQLAAESYTAINELVICAHGDQNGQVLMDPELTIKTMTKQHDLLVRLRGFLDAGAEVNFVACSAGGYENGDVFLTYLSTIWAGSLVVGHEVPLRVQGPVPGYEAVIPWTYGKRSDKWGETAKWSLNGAITRGPLGERLLLQEHDPTFAKRCGSDACLGHKTNGDMCDPFKRRHFPTWPVSNDEMLRLQKLKEHPAPGPMGKHAHTSHFSTSKAHQLDLNAPAHHPVPGLLISPGHMGCRLEANQRRL